MKLLAIFQVKAGNDMNNCVNHIVQDSSQQVKLNMVSQFLQNKETKLLL